MLPWISVTYPDKKQALQQDSALAHTTKSLAETSLRWQIAVLPLYSLPQNLLDYDNRSVVQPKGKAMAHPKMGALKRTVWQRRAAKVKQC
jgi:hypothetical protein